jgi:IS30 family transposase
MVMKIADHLSKEERMKLERLKKLQKEKLSPRDLRDLMGTDRQTYKRNHGAITNK